MGKKQNNEEVKKAKDTKVEDFWNKVKTTEVAEKDKDTKYAVGNISGVTASNTRTGNAGTGRFEGLNKKMKLNMFGSADSWEEIALANQTKADIAVNTLFGGLVNVAAGFVEGVSGNDPVGIFNSALGRTEGEYGNVLHDFAKSMMETVDENFHVYRDPNGSPFSFDYWGGQLQSFGYTVGMIGEVFVEQAVLKGAGSAKSGAKVSKAVSKLMSPAVFGSYQGIKEGYINALQTGEETYKSFLAKGYSEEKAKKLGNEAATLGFRMEVMPLMALNSLQFATIGKYNAFKTKTPNLGFSGGVETLGDKLFKGIKNKRIRAASDYLLATTSEMLEEGIQTGVSKEAQYQTSLKEGIIQKQQIGNRLFDGPEMRDSIIMGGFGGLLFKSIGNARAHRMFLKPGEKQQQMEYDEFLFGVANRVGKDSKRLEEAFKTGDEKIISQAKKNMQDNNVYTALYFDYLNQKETGFDTYVDTLTEKHKAATSGDPKAIKEAGIDSSEDLDYIISEFPKFIAEAKVIKENFNTNFNKYKDMQTAVDVTGHELSLKEIDGLKSQFDTELTGLKSEARAKLSPDGATKLDLLVEKAAIMHKAKGSITKEQRAELKEVHRKIGEIEDSPEYGEHRLKDNKIIDSSDINSMIKARLEILELNDAENHVREALVPLRDLANIEKRQEERRNRQIEKTKSVEKLKKIKEELLKSGKANPKTVEVVDSKIAKSELNEAVAKPTPPVAPTEEELNKQRGDTTDIINDLLADLDPEGGPQFQPVKIDSYPKDKLDILKEKVRSYYENLKEEAGGDLTFEEFIKDFIKHSNKAQVDRIYEGLVKAWEENGYQKADYKNVYNLLLSERADLAKDILSSVEDIIESKEELIDENKKQLEEARDKQAPIVLLEEENSYPKTKDVDTFRTTSPNLKAAFLSVNYTREILETDEGLEITDTDSSDELNQSEFTKSHRLLSSTVANKGEVFSVGIPDNFEDIPVAYWEDAVTKGQGMTFKAWVEKTGVDKDSQRYRDKIPMAVFDSDGEILFLLHDVEWYNPINLGFKDNPIAQKKLIRESRAALRGTRNDISSGTTTEVRITEKRMGTWKQIIKEKTPVKLKDADPTSVIGTLLEGGVVQVNGEPFSGTVINSTILKVGHTYEIRKSVNKGEYIALDVFRENISPETISLLEKVLESYIYKANNVNSEFKKRFKEVTGQSLDSPKDLVEVLSMFIPTYGNSRANNPTDVYNLVEKDAKIKPGTPYMTTQNGSVVVGIKGVKLGEQGFIYIHPAKVSDGKKSVADTAFAQILEILPKFKNNISVTALDRNQKLVTNIEDIYEEPTTYLDYLRGNLTTATKAFNIPGTNEYTTIVQPVINFEAVQRIDIKEEANRKAKENLPLNQQEEAVAEVVIETEEGAKTPEQIKEEADRVLKELGDDFEGMFAPKVMSETQVEKVKETGSNIPGVTYMQRSHIVGFIYNIVTSRVDYNSKKGKSKGVNKNELFEEIKNSYESHIKPIKDGYTKVLNSLKALSETENTPEVLEKIAKLEERMEVFSTIENNWGKFQEEAMEKVSKYTGITETVLEEQDTTTDKIYSQISLEENGKNTASYRLKRFLGNIKQVDKSGKVVKGFLGLPVYVSFDQVYETLAKIFSTPTEMRSEYSSMLLRIEQNIGAHPWLQQVHDNLVNSDARVQNEFVYNYARHALAMKFAMFSLNRDGTYTLKVYDTNSQEVTRVIRDTWTTNFKVSGLVSNNSKTNKLEINQSKAKELLATFESWQKRIDADKVSVTNEEIQAWLSEFGIQLSEDLLEEMRSKKTYFTTNRGPIAVSFNTMFRKAKKTNGVFGYLADYLESVIGKEDTTFEDNPVNHPFTEASNILSKLSLMESKYAIYATTNSFRDGGKSIYGFTPSKNITDSVMGLKHDQGYRDRFLGKSFSKHSIILGFLNDNAKFQQNFYAEHLGITAMQELSKKVFGDNSITALSDLDHELTKIAMFQDTKQGDLGQQVHKNIGVRMVRMFLPTMSDKSQMILLNTLGFDIRKKHLTDSLDGLNDNVLELLYSQLVLPEVERIANFHGKVKSTDIKGYDFAAGLFTMMPFVNKLTDAKTGQKVIALMEADPGTYNADWFNSTIKEAVKLELQKFVAKKVNEKVLFWNENYTEEEKVKGKTTGKKSIKFFDNNYLASKEVDGGVMDTLKVSAYDFIVNSLITNANAFMLLAGDPAMYAKGGMKSFFKQDEKGNALRYLPKDEYAENAYDLAVAGDSLAVNMGKRLALLIAPGAKIANSVGDTYRQIYLKDQMTFTKNVPTLVEIFYGKNAVTNVERLTRDVGYTDEVLSELAETYPQIADYLSLEATDAQEYVTAKEHIDILFRQGRLEVETHDIIQEKLAKQKIAEKEGRPIAKEDILNYEELQLVFQPIKPVYTGFANEQNKDFDAMRMLYIKTSAFPLIPQVTKGSELDGLRKLLEDYQDRTKTNVRASYESGNKVGAINGGLEVFDGDGNFNRDLKVEDLDKFSMLLDRDNFRIQQDVPFKSGKRTQDTVSLGTQTLKLLFGDGIASGNYTFMFEGAEISGRGLYDEYNKAYSDYIDTAKAELLDELGLDKRGNTVNPQKTIQKLQKLLKKEAKERGYPKQDVEALELSAILKISIDGVIGKTRVMSANDLTTITELLKKEEVTEADIAEFKKITGEESFLGKEVKFNINDINFSLPLWLSPNSNRYEALLNAIVANRLSKLKMPGNTFVVGSEAGFKTIEDLSESERSNIVYTSKWQGELKPFTLKDGKAEKTQVLAPSKLRDNSGKLISFINADGTPNLDYIEVRNNRYYLKEDMFDADILSLTSFRIPTSAHVSMSELEVVGILPIEVGDLMIVPANLTKQKGLDFDVDKETTYQYHTYVNAEGKLERLGEKHRQEILKKLNEVTNESDPLYDWAQEADYTEKDISSDKKLKALNQVITNKLLENKILEVHKSILASNDPKVQAKINRVLSMDFAKSQSNMIAEVSRKEAVDEFSFLDDTYQKEKMYLGAAGKLGIGVYSNYVVFHSMVQQAAEPVGLVYEMFVEEGKIILPLHLQLGNLGTDGVLGKGETLGKQNWLKRSITEVFAERQNTATDNEKEQIMGKVNVNEITINVDSILTALGFDKDAWEITEEEAQKNKEGVVKRGGKSYRVGNIPYLLLSQPIIKEFVTELKNATSNIKDFNSEAKDTVVQGLLRKYGMTEFIHPGIMSEYTPIFDKTKFLTGEALYNSLSTPVEGNKSFQQAVLEVFLMFDSYGTSASRLQGSINISSSGLGKSFFETIEKYDTVADLDQILESKFNNGTAIVGDYVGLVDYDSELHGDYLRFGSVFVKPNNPASKMALEAINTAYNVWGSYFPYARPELTRAFDGILTVAGKTEASESSKALVKAEIFQEFKKYLYSSTKLGLFQEDPQLERHRLFIDTPEKQSLAKYLHHLFNESTDHNYLRNNKLLSRFKFDLNQTDKPSTIKFDNTKGENFDEDYFYNAIIELVESNKELPSFNGETYSTRRLAQDLVAYSFLEGGVQEAVQFVKYIPLAYLNAMGFADFARLWNPKINPGILEKLIGEVERGPSKFERAYFQHNPQSAVRVTSKFVEDLFGDVSEGYPNQVTIDTSVYKEYAQAFISVYNPFIEKGYKKFELYERTGKHTFTKVPVLGIFGMSEYSIRQDVGQSLVNENPEQNIIEDLLRETTPTGSDNARRTGVEYKSISEVIEDLKSSEDTFVAQIASQIQEYLPEDIKIEIVDFRTKFNRENATGAYAEGKVFLDTRYVLEAEQKSLDKTLIHELVHAVTADYAKKFVNKDGSYIAGTTTPASITSLVVLFNRFKKHIGEDRIQKLVADFKAGKKLTKEQGEIDYASLDIFEFMAIAMTEESFQQELSKIQYNSTGKSFLEKFFDTIKSILSSIGIKMNDYQAELLSSILEIVEESYYDGDSKVDIFTSGNPLNRPTVATFENLKPIFDC